MFINISKISPKDVLGTLIDYQIKISKFNINQKYSDFEFKLYPNCLRNIKYLDQRIKNLEMEMIHRINKI